MTTGSSDATRAALLVAAGAAVGAAVGAHVRVSSWCPAMPWGKKSARAGSTANARASKEELIANLGLIPHPEGGFFCETYRSGCAPLASKGLTDLMGNMMTTTRGPTPERNVMTSIYYMLTPEHDFQAWVVNASDHVHYHHAGGTFVYHIVSPNGTYYTRRCGGCVANGDEPQVVVPGGSFKAVRLEEGFEFGIIGEGVAPGFDFRDFKFVTEEELKGRSAEAHAAAADLVKKEPEDVKFQSFYED